MNRRPPRSRAWGRVLLLACGGALSLQGCGGSGSDDAPDPPLPPTPSAVVFTADFTQGAGGWLPGQADYSPSTAPEDVVWEVRPLPAPFAGTGLYHAGTNRSDDLLLYSSYRVTGLRAATTYRVSFQLRFVTDVPSGCVGVGGSPGESVWLVAGVAARQPASVFDGTYYRLNFDRGNQSVGGPEGVVLGTLANSVPDCGPRRPESRQLSTPQPSPLSVVPDALGQAWIVIGLDSGFEARSEIHYQQVVVTFTPT